MKKERLEELVALSLRNGSADEVRAILLAVERETVERCAEACDKHEDDWHAEAAKNPSGSASSHYSSLAAGAGACCAAIRSLLTEE